MGGMVGHVRRAQDRLTPSPMSLPRPRKRNAPVSRGSCMHMNTIQSLVSVAKGLIEPQLAGHCP